MKSTLKKYMKMFFFKIVDGFQFIVKYSQNSDPMQAERIIQILIIDKSTKI